jgi:Fic family protein
MNKKEFKASETGKVIRASQGYWAFVPAPLPPSLQYDAELVRQLSRADSALSELSGLGRQLPNPHLLIAPWVRREAVLSSRIEGTHASLSDVLQDELGAPRKSAREEADVREVRNYVTALEYGIERLNKLPLSLRLVRELHERLMKGVRGDRATPGEFRRSQNWIGESGSTPTTASYVPPPVHEMEGCLDSWEKFLHQRDTMPDLVQCALMHEQFEAIHPFLDGNGRVGRLLITLFLMERGRLSQPLLYLSAYIEKHRQDYYTLLQRVRTHGDWASWLRYFIHGVELIATDAVKRTTRLLDLRKQYQERVRARELYGTAPLIDELFVNPYVTVARAERVMKVSNPTARAAVKNLQGMKILKEITGRGWGRIYAADAVRKVIEEK